MTAPRYRSDIKGMVKEVIADFESACRNQIQRSDDFIFIVEDAPAYAEYRDTLTHAEMASAFKRAAA